ncbi:KTSC domain-containing protein [Variovorax guangxiensis]|uniref:KTSC domain-containing protein n=1 Tax=Variovorax guangxiensis TaxID=1775474 RepID=A0A3S0ZPC7_9BURK|nr:KTSC domain-containing protein [Variovorax guangxiensis]
MEETRFVSNALVKGTYEPTTSLLRLWFTSEPHQGYDYPGVPASVWHGLCLARSAGTYYNEHIRDQYGNGFRPAFGPRRR